MSNSTGLGTKTGKVLESSAQVEFFLKFTKKQKGVREYVRMNT